MPTPLSVVLATYNRRPILERTLDALANQTVDRWQINLSTPVLHRVLQAAYYLGQEEGATV